ncbi:hypothetical protein, partial [Neisseria sicca]
VLSAASSPCPDLNLIHYNTRSVVSRHSRAGGNPFLKFRNCSSNQGFSSFTMDSRLRGNDGIA